MFCWLQLRSHGVVSEGLFITWECQWGWVAPEPATRCFADWTAFRHKINTVCMMRSWWRLRELSYNWSHRSVMTVRSLSSSWLCGFEWHLQCTTIPSHENFLKTSLTRFKNETTARFLHSSNLLKCSPFLKEHFPALIYFKTAFRMCHPCDEVLGLHCQHAIKNWISDV